MYIEMQNTTRTFTASAMENYFRNTKHSNCTCGCRQRLQLLHDCKRNGYALVQCKHIVVDSNVKGCSATKCGSFPVLCLGKTFTSIFVWVSISSRAAFDATFASSHSIWFSSLNSVRIFTRMRPEVCWYRIDRFASLRAETLTKTCARLLCWVEKKKKPQCVGWILTRVRSCSERARLTGAQAKVESHRGDDELLTQKTTTTSGAVFVCGNTSCTTTTIAFEC